MVLIKEKQFLLSFGLYIITCFLKESKKKIFHIAYMNNTTWLVPNKNAMSRSLKIADSFNSYTGIQVNTKKTNLIIINLKEQVKSIKYDNNTYEIKAIENNKPVRFL